MDRMRIKNVWIHHVDQYIWNCLNRTKQKQYKKMSLLTSRASHLSAGIASHTLLTIMFKDVPLLFWFIPFCRILINSLNYFWQAPGKSHSDPLKTKNYNKNIVTNSIRICNKINFKYSVDGILHYFANHINNHQEWHEYEVKKPEQQNICLGTHLG